MALKYTKRQTIKIELAKKNPNINYYEVERDGRLNIIALSNYFTKPDNLLRLPQDLSNVTRDTRVNFYAFTTKKDDNNTHSHTFYRVYDFNSESYKMYTMDQLNNNRDTSAYIDNHEKIMEFLRKIEENTENPIANIYIHYNATLDDTTNRVFPWHDDLNFSQGKDTRQMAILLTPGYLTEYAIGKEPDLKQEKSKAEQELKFNRTVAGWATYWRNPIIHRKPLQPTKELRVAILLVFDFFHYDENSMNTIYSRVKEIQNESIQEAIYNELSKAMQSNQMRSFDKEADIVIQGGRNLSRINIEPTINCLERDHPSCSNLFGGNNKYKYKGRWYKLRYGMRGGRHIIVNGVVKYV
jgi:hypothetical protein